MWRYGASFAMLDDDWNELAILTARIEMLSGERTTARYMRNAQSREQFHSEIETILKRRDRLIDRLSGHLAEAGQTASAAAP
jgi:hypothetical protein